MRLTGTILLLAAVWPAGSASASPQAATQSLAEYIATLDGLATEIETMADRTAADSSQLLDRLPFAWVVQTPDRTWRVSTWWLREELGSWSRRGTERRSKIVGRLRMMRAEAEAIDAPRADVPAARDMLNRILAADEFRAVHEPSWLDRLRQRVLMFLVNLLGRLLGSSAVPTITSIVVYALIGLALGLTALWMYRALRRGASADAAQLDLEVVPLRRWADWWTDADAAAGEGQWRQAIRLAYWCGIAFLEARGAWRADASRTPREYLALVPPSAHHAAALQGLTRLIERVWYGRAPADRTGFEEARAHLKALGCPSA